jgi:NTE family protein
MEAVARPRKQLIREGFWDNFAASKPAEIMLNAFAFRTIAAEEMELPIFGINAPILGLNPGGALYRAMTACLPGLGVRKQYFDFRIMLDEACPQFGVIDWDNVKTRLLVGASEVLNGIETVFDSDCNKGGGGGNPRVTHRWRQRLPLSLEGVAASGTLPILREAERIGGKYYWDGLYSQNPPVRELIAGVDQEVMPDELWIIRINGATSRKVWPCRQSPSCE